MKKYPKNTVIHCCTQEIADIVGKMINNKCNIDWRYYREEFCLVINPGSSGSYGSLSFFTEDQEKRGWRVISYEEFLGDSNGVINTYELF